MVALNETRRSRPSRAAYARLPRENPPPPRSCSAPRSPSVQRARSYDPTTGEFTSRDPLEYVDGMSVYRGYFVSAGVDPRGKDCQPPLTSGIHYVLGRGGSVITGGLSTDIENPYPDQREDTFTRVHGMWMHMYFVSNVGAFDDEKCGCCCDSVGFVQIISQEKIYQGFWSNFQPEGNLDWNLDGGIPYLGGRAGNPCPGPAKIDAADLPTASDWGFVSWLFRAEICAVCLSGIEGPREFVSDRQMGYPLVVSGGTGLVAYDCARWEFGVSYDSDRGYSKSWEREPPRIIGEPSYDRWLEALTSTVVVGNFPTRGMR
jgi:hypothetical protein